jgi:hypothetical protein
MDRTKHILIVLYSFLFGLFVTNTSLAQHNWFGENIVVNGDFSSGSDNWIIEGGLGTVSHNDTLKFEVSSAGNPWELQSYQSLTAEQIAALAQGGDWELSFDAMSPDGAKNFHVFLGQVGGSWARYWPSEGGNGPGDVAVNGEWKTYTLSTTIFETWDAMKLGFEVAADNADLMIDNIKLRPASNNIVFNGDFSLGDSAWVFEGADVSVTDGELVFGNIPGAGNPWEVQAHQFFTSGTDGINNKDSIYVGPYQVLFDARTTEGTQELHLFLGEVGGGWARYLSTDAGGNGRFTVDTEMKNYSVNFGVDQVWETMRIGFEVNYTANASSDLFIDNVIFTRVDDIKPDAPQVALSSDDGIIKIDVIDNSSAAYDVYFSTAPFSDPRDGRLLTTLNTETGLSTIHTIKAPHHSMVKNYTAYVGVVAKSAKGSASEMSSVSINTITSINENYIFQLNSDAVNAVGDALNEGTVPSGEALAAFFPSDYKPFTITSDAKVVNGEKPADDNDLSGKFWIGYETTTGSDYLIIYSEIKDDLLVPGEWDATSGAPNSGGAWNYDSFEGGFSTYSITDPVMGSPNHQMGVGTSDYQYRIGVTDNADNSGYVPYVHAYNIGAVNGSVPNSATVAEVTDGMYRTLTLLSIRELSNLEATNSHIEFPGVDGVSAIPFHLSLNDNDIIGGGRETQNVWSDKALDENVWQTPSQWEIVGLVGSNVEYIENTSTVTFNVNMSPLLDTLMNDHVVQMRGGGISSNQITWDSNTLNMTHVDGDLWTASVNMVEGETLQYKFWAGVDPSTPLVNESELGWESGANNEFTLAVGGNITLPLQWYELREPPYIPYEDSVTLLFKVNLGSQFLNGEFNPDTDRVGVRGNPAFFNNPEDWSSTAFYLDEIGGAGDNLFYAGVARIHKNEIGSTKNVTTGAVNSGMLGYKFVIEKNGETHWETRDDRFTFIPEQDSTLKWVYFNDDQSIHTTSSEVEEPVLNAYYNGIQKFQQFGKIIHSIFNDNIHRKIILDDEGNIKEQCNDPSLLWGSYDVLNMSDNINDYVYYVGKNGFYARQKISTNCEEGDIEVLQSPTQVDITDISYYQGKIVIASSEGKLYSTTSIDENWSELFSSSSFYPNSIEINGNRIYLLGQSGNLFYSDNGNDWSKSNTGTFNNLNSIDFAGQNGFLVGDNGTIKFSIDGGENWQYRLTTPIEVDFNDVSFFDDEVGYIAGEYGYLFRTDDGGINWLRVRSDYGESYLQVVPMNPFVITYVGFGGNNGFFLESFTKFFDDAIASINNQTWQGISTFHNIGLANTADWVTMSWGNFGARQMGNEPREPFPNSPDDQYYFSFQQSWDLLTNSINTGEKLLAHLDRDETSYSAEEVLDFKVKLNTLIGLSYGQLGLKFDKAFSQSLKTKSLRTNNSLNTSNELYSYSTDIDNVDKEINEKELIQFTIPELSYLKSKMINSNQLLPYDEIINLSNTYLENAVNSYLYLESSQSNYQVTNLLQNTWNFDVFTRFVNTTSAAHLLYKARHSDDSIDLASIIDLTSNGLSDISIDVASDDGFDEWTHNAYVYSVYSGWGRVDQAVLNLIDPEYPSKHEGVDLPPLETSDQRFDEYFEYLSSNNFRPERGLYFFSNYRYKRIDPVINNGFTGGYPFVNEFENDLIRAEAFYLVGNNSEAISLINTIRVNSGSNLLELSSDASNEEIENALYYEWIVEVGPYSYGPTSWYTNRRYEKLQNGTITQLPIPALILEQNGMEIYTYGGIVENTIEPMEVYYPTNSDLVSTSPTVEWEEIDAAASYRLEIELNGEKVYDVNVTGNSHQVEIELNRNTQYRLIVNALDNSGTSIRASNYITFRTVNNPFLAPLIIAPREGQEVSTSGIRLYWKDQCDISIDENCWNSPGMASWLVQISNDSNFVSIDEEFFLTERPLSNTRYSLTDLTPPLQINGKTYLRMKITTPGGDSEWSNTRSVNLMGEPNINTMSLIVEGGYGKTNHTLSSRIFVDQLYEGAKLYSFQFELSVSEGFNFDSLRSSIDISDIVFNFDTETNVLKVAGASTQKIPHDKPIAELFYHFSEVGEHNLILTEGKLNSEPVSDKYSGSIFIDEFIPGDVDDNKVVDAFDAAVILHRVVDKELIPNDSVLWWDSDIWFNWRYNAADVSQDDNLNALDASLILQKIVGLISDYPSSMPENSGITLAIENGQILISTEDEINAITLTLNKSEYFSLNEPDYLVSNVTGVWNETDEKYMFSMAAPAGINENLLSFPYEINTSESFILELKSETDNTIKEYSFEISNTGIVSEEYEKEQPIRYHLSQNYPNPFNPSTRIEYSLPEASNVRLEVYNSLGKKIMEIVNGQKPAGNYTATFDASNLSSGVYLYKLTTPSFTQTKKMLLIK